MIALRRRILLQAAKVFDLELMVFSFGLATVLVARQNPATTLEKFLSLRITIANVGIFALFHSSGTSFFPSTDVQLERLSARWVEVLDIVKATTLGSAIIYVAAILLRVQMVTPLFILYFWVASTLAGVSSRVLFRFVLGALRRRGRNLREMVVVGTNPRALRFVRKIEAQPELGYRIAGFVDGPWWGLGIFEQSGYPVVSDLAGFPRFLREQIVDEVVIALPMKSAYGQAARIAALCEEQGVTVPLLSDIFNLRLAQPTAGEFEGEPSSRCAPGAGRLAALP